MALCKRVLKSAADTAFLSRRGLYSSSSVSTNGVVTRASELVKSAGDTLALVRGLEAKGVPTAHAEAITSAITGVSTDSLDNVQQLQRTVMLQEAKLSKFEAEVKSLQEHHFSMLTRETEKLQSVIDKMHSELRYELDKVAAGSRLDLILEKRRMRDEFNNQNAETANLTNNLDREIQAVKALVETGKYANYFEFFLQEIQAVKALVETGKYEVIKYCIGTVVPMTAVGIAILRIMMN